jgi:hypothetical protein
MDYDDMNAAADKWLHADGSVTTLAGALILPADEERAEEYVRREPNAAKWLMPDGSVASALPFSGGSPLNYYFAQTTTTASTVNKVLTGFPADYVPSEGDLVFLKYLSAQNSATSPKFSINGAVYNILFSGIALNAVTNNWRNGSIIPFYFDGTNFHQLYLPRTVDNDTTYTTFMEVGTPALRFRMKSDRQPGTKLLMFEQADGVFDTPLVVLSGSTSKTKVIQTDIEWKVDGMIYFTIYAAVFGVTTTPSTALTNGGRTQTYQANDIIQCSLNGADNLEKYSWVYIVGIPQINPMSYKLDPTSVTSWYTTALPTHEDGKVYIRLGYYGDSNGFFLTQEHPAYWFKDGAVRPYLTRGDVQNG